VTAIKVDSTREAKKYDTSTTDEVTSSKAASTEVGLAFERGMSTPLKSKI
jgi:hypothetical protein